MNLPRVALLILAMSLTAAALADEIRVGEQLRTFHVVAPKQAHKAPLVLVLHGNSQQGSDMMERTSWPQIAEQEKFIAVFPDGMNRAWNDLRAPEERAGSVPPDGTDDVAFLTALVDSFVKQGVADSRRIYVTGVSNGGAMTMTLACKRPDLFAAAASAIMEFTAIMRDACKPIKHIPMLVMNGTADPLIPYEGGQPKLRRFKSGYLSTTDTVNFWRLANGCKLEDEKIDELADIDHNDHSSITRIESQCSATDEVILYKVNGGGHRLPDRKNDSKQASLVEALLGSQNHDINGPEVIWQFLRRHALL